MTKPGTSSSDFQNLIQGLPDEGTGVQITYPNLDWQGYVTKLNDTFAATVGQMSIIEATTLDAPEAETGVVDKRGLESLLAHDYAAMPVRRQVNAGPPPPTNNLVRQTGSQQALKVLSQGRANNLAGTLEDVSRGPDETYPITDALLTAIPYCSTSSMTQQLATVSPYTCSIPASYKAPRSVVLSCLFKKPPADWNLGLRLRI